MKHLFIRSAFAVAAMFSGLLFVGLRSAHSLDYTVTVSSFVPTASAGDFTAGGNPDITGGAYIRQIAISNESAVAQTITVYDTCTSSTAATLNGTFALPATIGTYWIPSSNTFLPQIFKLTSPCIVKSSSSSVVKATYFYE